MSVFSDSDVAFDAVARARSGDTTAQAAIYRAFTVNQCLMHLRSRSQALETVLDALPERPAVVRADTSLPIGSLESQVQWQLRYVEAQWSVL